MPDERRKHHRLPIEATTVQNVILSARVLNLSMTGIAIETNSGLYIGTRHRLRLRSLDRVVIISGSVRWCRLHRVCPNLRGDFEPVYRAGLRISSSPPEPTP